MRKIKSKNKSLQMNARTKNIVEFFKLKHRARPIFASFIAVTMILAAIACNKFPSNESEPALKNVRGFTLATWRLNGYSSSSTFTQIERIAGLGANHLAVLVTAYQGNENSSDCRNDPNRTPRLETVEHCVMYAKTQGLKVALKPQIMLDNGAWSGKINPDDPTAWFAAYREFLRPLAAMAEHAGVDQFIIGTELAGTLKHTAEWRQTIDSIRAVFSGKLLYAASWDEAAQVPFWAEMDYVGVNFYAPVTHRRDAGRLEMLAGWQPWLNKLEALHRQTGKPLLLTEIGYRSVDGAGMNPHIFGGRVSRDYQEQSDLYWAALQATRDVPWIDGMFWWNWLASGEGGMSDSDFTPADKPAETEIRKSWRE